MTLPSADELEAIFAAARRNGLTHLRCGSLEFKLAPLPAIAAQAEATGAPPESAELQDTIARLKREAATLDRRPISDPLDILSQGGRLVEADPDPSAAS